MDTNGWIFVYVLQTTFLLWIIFLGGAARLEGTFASGFLIHYFAPNWSEAGIRAFAWIWLIGSTVFFVLGFFDPSFRGLVSL